MGFDITHVYGLTEVYGPATVCAKHDEWESLDVGERARLNGRQGVRYLMEDGLTVMDPQTMQPVPADGETMGEIMFRGNITMKGYLKNAKATREAFSGGWFHSGDLAVMQPDGYVKIKDRVQGHHHLGRREHLVARGRGRALPPSRGAGRGSGGDARREVGRNALRLRGSSGPTHD